MGLRSTVLLALPVALLVWASFASERTLDPPPPSHLPVTWTATRVDGVSGPNAGRFATVAFDSRGHGLIGSTASQIFISEDGGRGWRSAPGPAVATTNILLREDGLTLASVANGRVFRSSDGGLSWAMVREPGRAIQGLLVVAGDTVLAVGDRTVLLSTDAGETWGELEVPVVGQVWYDAAFATSRLGYLVGGVGQLLRTTDGGRTWARSVRLTDAMIRGVATSDERRAVVVGSGGEILRTEDAGETWAGVASGTDQLLNAVAFRDADHGIAVGMWGSVVVTSDGGRTWAVENSGTEAHLHHVAFTPDGTAVAVGWLGTIIRRDVADASGVRTP